MERRTIKITFSSQTDFRKRIAGLWQDQKKDEVYEFTFPDEETEKQFEDLMDGANPVKMD